jgi:hypothetical protein
VIRRHARSHICNAWALEISGTLRIPADEDEDDEDDDEEEDEDEDEEE